MTAEDDRARAYLADQATILRKRAGYARGLLAPAYPRARVMAAWAPLLPDTAPLSAAIEASTPPPIPPPSSGPAGRTWEGHGTPDATDIDLSDAATGDLYLDLDTGNLYTLNAGP